MLETPEGPRGGGGEEEPPRRDQEQQGERRTPQERPRRGQQRGGRRRRERLPTDSWEEASVEEKRIILAETLNIPMAFLPTEKEVEVVGALLNPENFAKFVQKIANNVRGEAENLTEKQLQIKISEEVELKLVLFFNNLFSNLDVSKPTKFYQEIAQKDPFYNFQVTFERIEKQLSVLADNLLLSTDPTVREVVENMTFWKQGEVRSDEELMYTLDEDTGEEMRYVADVVKPYPVRVRAKNIADFVQYLKIIVGHEQELREYTQNAQAMFFQQPGEGGFYERLAGYSSEVRTSDIDQFLALPDNNLVREAMSLYQKVLEKEFAKYDWIHEQNMFDIYFENNTKMELETLRKLKELHPSEEIEDWRLRRALKLAVGSSLGIFLNEVQTAAYADPPLDPKGSFSFTSYYRNDNQALGPLNPFPHNFWRWQQEGTLMADLLFLPVKGAKLPKYWNHRIVFEELERYKEDFKNRQLKPIADGRVRLIDIMNPARLGGPVMRAGWRTWHGYERWLVYQTKEIDGKIFKDTDKWNYFESWKALENIGFEVLFDFAIKFNLNYFAGRDNEKREFFKHIYQKYINPDSTDGDFDTYFTDLERKANNMEKPGIEAKDQGDVYKFEIFRALSGVLKARIPTKFLRLERGRFLKGGKKSKLWDTIQNEMGLTIGEFDEILGDIMLAETLLREEASSKMSDWISEQPEDPEVNLNNLQIDNYRLTNERLEQLLRSKNISPEKIERAKNLLTRLENKLDDSYLEMFGIKLEQRASDTVRTDLPFDIAAEELDMRFINFRGGGGRVLPRAIGEIARSEKEVLQHLSHYTKYLLEAAVNPKHDMGKLVEALYSVERFIEEIHGKAYAYEVAHHLALATIAYFEKDTAARALGLKLARFGKFNSLAARFSGTYRGVWEWEVADIDNFIVELERQRIQPKDAYDYSRPPKTENKKFIGLIPYKKEIREKQYLYHGRTLRENGGATLKHRALEIVNKYLPLILMGILLSSISKAFKEEFGEKR